MRIPALTFMVFDDIDGGFEDGGFVNLCVVGGHHVGELSHQDVELITSLLLTQIPGFPETAISTPQKIKGIGYCGYIHYDNF